MFGGNPKAPRRDVYKHLFLVNHHCETVIDLLHHLRATISNQEHRYCLSMLQEVRALISQSVTEHLNSHEVMATAQAERSRMKLEKKLFR